MVILDKAANNAVVVSGFHTAKFALSTEENQDRLHTLVCLPNLYKTNKGHIITKTYLYNFDPLKPNFYIVKLGFTRVYIIFVISAQKHRLLVLVRTASTRRF